MYRPIFLLFLMSVCSAIQVHSQDDSAALQQIRAFQTELNKEYKDKQTSPLEPKDLKKFSGHDFFPIDLSYRVRSTLARAADSAFFDMKTTTGNTQRYRIYAWATFDLAGMSFKLPVYQSQSLMRTREYADYLFFPFTDLTNGTETYGGGRFIELSIPKTGNELVIDFNMAYNPYCAYSHRYSCPVVPQVNHVDTEVRAGVKFQNK
ncbi:MAG TPA: DUF1684 domain-containing protein [Cyclobacteriaceae bacterium]|nr:DUF1684 domain-containing protein [Cyclobacteriaceae bacterium]